MTAKEIPTILPSSKLYDIKRHQLLLGSLSCVFQNESLSQWLRLTLCCVCMSRLFRVKVSVFGVFFDVWCVFEHLRTWTTAYARVAVWGYNEPVHRKPADRPSWQFVTWMDFTSSAHRMSSATDKNEHNQMDSITKRLNFNLQTSNTINKTPRCAHYTILNPLTQAQNKT